MWWTRWTRWTELVSQYSWSLQIEMLWGFCWSCWSVSLSRRGADTYVIVSALPSSSIRRQWVLVLSWAKMPCFVGILLAENLSCIIEVGLQKIGITEWISGLKFPSDTSEEVTGTRFVLRPRADQHLTVRISWSLPQEISLLPNEHLALQ